jgi:ATP-dependent DNA helicase RecQ
VAEKPDANRLILAGPGSGKTRVIVHRVAYLLRVLREAPGSIIVLAFNRGAAWEIRQRLRQLIGNEAARCHRADLPRAGAPPDRQQSGRADRAAR